MRLIDADRLIEALNLCGCYKHINPEAYDTLMKYEILGAIEVQPTAYDMDNVIEELEESSIEFEVFGRCSEFVNSVVAIDIVKRGGVDERKN